jgi:F-type H+-transporting ATPase subunit epsilon
MSQLTVELVTPERRILSDVVDEAIVPGWKGLFGVRPGHAPFMSLMDAGVVTLKKGGSTQTFFISGGFAEVLQDRVLILADQAEPTADIDVEAARRRLETAQEKLKGMSAEDVQFEMETATVRRETARMSAASLHR